MANQDLNVNVRLTDNFSQKLKQLDRRLSTLEKKFKKVDGAAKKASNGIKKAGNSAKKSSQGVLGLTKNIEKMVQKMGLAGVVSTSTIDLISRFASVTVIIGAVVRAFGALVGGIKRAFTNAAEFDAAFAEVNTILSGTKKEADAVEKAIVKISTAVIQSPTDLAKGFYQVISAGVTNATEALLVLEVAAKSATAGITDTATAVDAITTIINAFGKQASDAADISDDLFNTVKEGKLIFSDLANNIGKVAPFAAQTGVSFEEMLAALAALTKGGLNMELASTAMKSALVAVLKPSKQATDLAEKLGIEWTVASLRAKGLLGFLAEVQKATGGNARQIAQLFGNARAMTAALALAGNQMGEFSRISRTMETDLGATDDAVAEATSTLEAQFKLLKAKLNPLIKAAADNIRDPFTKTITGMNESLSATDVLLGKLERGFIKVFGANNVAVLEEMLNLFRGDDSGNVGDKGPLGKGFEAIGLGKTVNSKLDLEAIARQAGEGQVALAAKLGLLGSLVSNPLTAEQDALNKALAKRKLIEDAISELLIAYDKKQNNLNSIFTVLLKVYNPEEAARLAVSGILLKEAQDRVTAILKTRREAEKKAGKAALAVAKAQEALAGFILNGGIIGPHGPVSRGTPSITTNRGIPVGAPGDIQKAIDKLALFNEKVSTMADSLDIGRTAAELFASALASGTKGLQKLGPLLAGALGKTGAGFLGEGVSQATGGLRDSLADGLFKSLGSTGANLLTGGLFTAAGGLLGSLFGGKDERKEELATLQTIARNTGDTNNIFRQLIGAPSDFVNPNIGALSYQGIGRQVFNDVSRG